MEEKGEGFTERTIKDTWTITRGVGNRRRWVGLVWWGGWGEKPENCT